jgi:hypothetical protein
LESDFLYGGGGNDTLKGGGGPVDRLFGGDDDDRFFVNKHNGTSVHLGESHGVDTLDFSEWAGPSGVTVSLSINPSVAYWVDSAQTVSLRQPWFESIENVIGSAYDDEITGSSLANVIDGGAGNDVLNGLDDVDAIDGGFGDDEFLVNLDHTYMDDLFSDPDQVPGVADGSSNINHPPRIQSIGDQLITAGDELTLDILAHDIDEPSSGLTLSFVGDDHGATILPDGTFHWETSFDLASETRYTFVIGASDNSPPSLRGQTSFNVTVLPATPKIGIVDYDFLGTPRIDWAAVPKAAYYVVERRVVDDQWEFMGEVSEISIVDNTYQLGNIYEYRVKAVDANGLATPFSVPIRSAILFEGVAQVFDAVTLPDGTVRVDFQIGPEEAPPNYDYAILRMTSSSGWTEIHRGPISDYQALSNGYRFIDAAPVANAYNHYDAQVIASGARSESFVGDYRQLYVGGPLVQPLVDVQLVSERAVSDAEETTIGHFLPLNNNFDEFNNNEFDELVPDNEPDFEDGHVIHEGPTPDPQLARMQVSLEGGTGTIEFEFPSSIKLWDGAEIVSGTVYDLDSAELPFHVQNEGITFYVEGMHPSTSTADVELIVRYTADALPTTVQEDRVRFTVGDLYALPAPDIAVDAEVLYISVPLAPGTTSFDGDVVDIRLYRHPDGGIYTEMQQAVVQNGSAVAVFDARPWNGVFFYVDTRFRDHEFSGRTEYFLIQPGDPGAISLSATKTAYTADSTDVTTITATIRDEFGNLVADGTPVSWSIPFGSSVYTDGTTTAATETTNGQATITLCAPDEPGIQRVVASAGSAEAILDIVAEAADFDIGGVAALDIATGQSGTVTISNANVADGTPVFWTLSNGEIVNGQDGGRVFAGVVHNGTASIDISATGPWARYGQAVVSATIAGRLYTHDVAFNSSGLFSVEIEQFVLVGDRNADGIETFFFGEANPTWQGGPAWGFGPPAQNWPAARDIQLYARTPVMIRGAANATYYVVADSPFSSFATFEGLGASNEIQTDANGIATFFVRSLGQLAANQFLAIEFKVREGSPFVGAPETTQRGMLVDHDTYARSIDFGKSVFGADPQGVSGIAGGFVGSLFLVGDIGSLVKNGWRAAGQSDEPVNKLEVALGGIGILTTAAPGGGDAPVAAIRSLIAATDGVKLGKILAGFLARGVSNAPDLARLGNFALKVMTSDAALQGAKQVLTSEALVEASIHAVDKLGDLGGAFLARIGHINVGPGTKVAQNITTLFGRLSDDSLNFFKTLSPSQLDDALDRLGTTLRAGRVDIGQLRLLLDNNHLFTAAYDRSLMIRDLSILSDSEGIGKLVNHLKRETLAGPIQGRLYELQTAAKLFDENPGWKVTFVSKYAKEVDPLTGKRLESTDIDFIVDDGTNLVYYQAKSSATAFGGVGESQRWVGIVREDARRNGVANQVIRYVTPDPNGVAQNVVDALEDLGAVIEASPLLR